MLYQAQFLPKNSSRAVLARTNSSSSSSENGFSLIEGLMRHYGTEGDAIGALRWALPKVLSRLEAEAGSLFLYREADDVLVCVVCSGPVDITGLVVPKGEGFVGRVFSTGEAEIVSDTASDKSHYRKADKSSGFKTVSTATAPVQLGERCFGAIQAINRKPSNDSEEIIHFTEADLSLLVSLASALALAISNVRLAEKVITDQILQRDLDQATEAQTALLPTLDSQGYLAGKVIAARHLSGDFFDYYLARGRVAFCQGDVAGKGITAALLMARAIALFRIMAKQNLDAAKMVSAINAELLDVSSERFITFVAGWFDCTSGEVEFVNCGHGPVLVVDETNAEPQIEVIESHTIPLGLTKFKSRLKVWRGNLTSAALYIATDGITEAKDQEGVWGFEGFTEAALTHGGLPASRRVADIMRKFKKKALMTHDDATLLVLTAIGRNLASPIESKAESKTEPKNEMGAPLLAWHHHCTLQALPLSLPVSRAFIKGVLGDLGWQKREIDIQLVIGEALQNIIRYGFDGGDEKGVIHLSFSKEDARLLCIIEDSGHPANQERWQQEAEKRRPIEGGYGLRIINALASSYAVTTNKNGNHTRLMFNSEAQDEI